MWSGYLAAMAILKSNFLFSRRKSAEAAPETSPADAENPDEKNDVRVSSNDVPSDDVQTGVQKIQAVRSLRPFSLHGRAEDDPPDSAKGEFAHSFGQITLTWSRTSMFAILCLYVSLVPAHDLALTLRSLWLVTLANGFRSAIFYSLTPYATSDFGSHSLLTTINIVARAMTAALYIPVAKLVDVWGRAEGWLFMVVLSTVGLVMMAASKNIETYCAADVRIGTSLCSPHANGAGLLLRRVCWHELHPLRPRSRRHQPQEPRYCVCLYLVSLHDYGLCGVQGRREVPAERQLALGVWCFCHHHPLRCLSGLLCPPGRSEEGRAAGHHSADRAQWPDTAAERPAPLFCV